MKRTDDDNAQRAAALLHHRSSGLAPGDATTLPMTASSTFHLPDGSPDSFYYARNDTPVWRAVEAQLEILEAAACLIFPSGMAAISTALMSTLSAGSRLLIPSDGYFATRRFAHECLTGYGVEVEEYATPDIDESRIDAADVLFIETPTNPRLDVCDIAALVTRAHATDTCVIVDNTTSTPFLQRPLDLGADIVVAADTKAPGGHSDVLAGHLATRDAARLDAARRWRGLGGAIIGPEQAWLLHSGLETLELRLARMCTNAAALAEALVDHPQTRQVRYPGLASDPSHALATRQMNGFGTIVGIELEDAAAANRLVDRCPLIASATSFGGVHTSAERRARWGDAVPEGYVRLSAGCEPTHILIKAVLDALFVE